MTIAMIIGNVKMNSRKFITSTSRLGHLLADRAKRERTVAKWLLFRFGLIGSNEKYINQLFSVYSVPKSDGNQIPAVGVNIQINKLAQRLMALIAQIKGVADHQGKNGAQNRSVRKET